MSAIEDLFNGKIYPSEQVQSTSKLYQSSKIAAMALSQKLTNSLSSEQREWFDTYCTEGALMNSEMYLAFFRCGMRIGAQLERELHEGSGK